MKMNIVRYIMCGLLTLGALGHLYGTFDGYQIGSEVFVWSLSATAFTLAVVAFNILARSGDGALLVAAMVSAFAWAVLATMFGAAVDNMLDPRAIAHAVPSLILAALDASLLLRDKKRRASVL
jgi:hypothetical protein